jgi:hypothetical protein
MKNLLFSTLLILSGCATGSHIVTGKIHPAISPEAVKFFDYAPANSEIIGIITAQNVWLYKQPGADSVQSELKSEAAKLGANGVVLKDVKSSAWTGASVSGTAIFTP